MIYAQILGPLCSVPKSNSKRMLIFLPQKLIIKSRLKSFKSEL
jgi:hypothetical protein